MPKAKLYKDFISKADVDDDERTITATISTSAVDRDKDVILPKGAEIENYMKNPVVLWAHQYSEAPIGKAIYIDKKRKSIVAKVAFPKAEQSAKADEIYNLFKAGFLNAFSIGFIPAEDGSHEPTAKELEKNPDWAGAKRIYDKWELLEFSAVPVPANPEALLSAYKSKSIAISDDLIADLGIIETESDDSTKTWAFVDDIEEEIYSDYLMFEDGTAINPDKIKCCINIEKVIPIEKCTEVKRIRSYIDDTIEAIKRIKGVMY